MIPLAPGPPALYALNCNLDRLSPRACKGDRPGQLKSLQIPDTRDLIFTEPASSSFYIATYYHEMNTMNKSRLALGAVGIITFMSGKVADIDVFQTCSLSGSSRSL